MAEPILIESVMHPMPHCISTISTLDQAKKMMTEHNVRHLPVKSGGDLVGVITDRDISYVLSGEAITPEDLKVDDAFSSSPYVVDVSASVAEVAQRMATEHLGCALVTKDGDLVGIFTTVDACRLLAKNLSGGSVS